MSLFTHGVHLPDQRGRIFTCGIEVLPVAEKLYIPLPEKLLEQVRPGATVRRGQRLWENEFRLPVYSPVNGRIEDVVRQNHPLFGEGCYIVAAVTKPDNKPITLPDDTAYEHLSAVARMAAIVDETDGVPLFAKLRSLRKSGGTVVANATTADPHTAASLGVVLENPARVLRGLELTAAYIDAEKYGVAVSRGAVERSAKKALRGHLFVCGKKYPTDPTAVSRKKPVTVVGVQAMAALAAAMDEHIVTDTCVVTVSGPAANRPRNWRVTEGTPLDALLTASEAEEADFLVMGDALTGILCEDAQTPVFSGVTCLLAMEELPARKAQPCTGCGECIRVCHRRLVPCEIARLLENMQYEQLPMLNPQRCDGCGACSYVCPAAREVTAAVLEACEVQGTIFMDVEGE